MFIYSTYSSQIEKNTYLGLSNSRIGKTHWVLELGDKLGYICREIVIS